MLPQIFVLCFIHRKQKGGAGAKTVLLMQAGDAWTCRKTDTITYISAGEKCRGSGLALWNCHSTESQAATTFVIQQPYTVLLNKRIDECA